MCVVVGLQSMSPRQKVIFSCLCVVEVLPQPKEMSSRLLLAGEARGVWTHPAAWCGQQEEVQAGWRTSGSWVGGCRTRAQAKAHDVRGQR